MATAKHHAVQFQHLADYRVLLCKTCAYCVLPNALDRHLKDIHHLPAAERNGYLNQIASYELAELPNVIYPSTSECLPVLGLPVLDGFACNIPDCRHHCVTAKRMEAHWRKEHHNVDHCFPKGTRWQKAQLQTFFRGNNLRYFPVSTTTTTPTIDSACALTPSSDKDETSIEWFLTRHFHTDASTSLRPAKGTAPNSWRDQVLQCCPEADFLRYALLSVAASHIAFSFPESRLLYSREASRYCYLSIDTLASSVEKVQPENFYPVFQFTRLMTLCCIAGVKLNQLTQHDHDHDHGDAEEPENTIVPPWWPIQWQSRQLIWPHRGGGIMGDAMHTDPKRLYVAQLLPESDFDLNPYDTHLSTLLSVLQSLLSTDEAVLEALDLLRRAWIVPCRDTVNSFRDMALMWPNRVSLRYIQLLESSDPAALVVFAHYCVLWSFSEAEYWYMDGHAETMLLRAVQRLPSGWQEWISWPCGMVFGDDCGFVKFDEADVDVMKIDCPSEPMSLVMVSESIGS